MLTATPVGEDGLLPGQPAPAEGRESGKGAELERRDRHLPGDEIETEQACGRGPLPELERGQESELEFETGQGAGLLSGNEAVADPPAGPQH
jgi:hypothetical protein